MHIQFRTLTIYSRSEEQIQACLHLKKSATSLLVVIEALGSPLGPHPESDLTTDLYSGSTPIVIMDETDRQINFNNFKESATSLSAVIGALGSSLVPHRESDLAIDLYSGSTLIGIKTSPITISVSDDFKKAITSL
jgi:hypothetical protein